MKKQTYKKLFTVATASAMAAGAVVAVAPTQADAAKSFSDVTVKNVHYENIMELTDRGVIKGYEDGTYRPGNSINRANAAKIIAGVLGLDTTNVKNPGFPDVSEKNGNYGAIAALANAGIIKGFKDGTYKPNDTLTRGQMAKIIANAFNLSGGDVNALPFTDVQKSQYKENIANLYENKVTTGVTETTFAVNSPVTRGQLASFVVRAENAAGTDGGSETPGTETPGSTTTSEKAVTLLNVTNNLVTINGEQFDIAPEVASVFNAANAEALKDSETTLVIEYTLEPTASLANVAKKGKIVGVKSLKLVKSGTSFDAKGYTIPTLTIAADNVTVANTVSTTLDVAANNKVTLNGVTATTLTVGKGAKITLGTGFKFTTIKLASGDKIENVITNYAAVKDLLKDTKIEQSSTGGGGGGNRVPVKPAPTTPPTAEVVAEYKKVVEDKIVAVGEVFKDFGTAELKDNTLTINLDETPFTVAAAKASLTEIVATLSGLGTVAAVDTIEIGDYKPFESNNGKAFSKLAILDAVANEFFNVEDPMSLLELKDENKNLLEVEGLKLPDNGEVKIKFKDGQEITYKVTMNQIKVK